MISVYAARFSALGLRTVSGTYPIVTVSELVEKEEERLRHQAAPYGEHLLLAAGKFRPLARQPLAQIGKQRENSLEVEAAGPLAGH